MDRLLTALVRWEPAPEPVVDVEPLPAGMLSLLAALRRLAYRGSGPDAWAAPLTDDPIAFLLDSTSDVVLVWTSSGRLLYANRAADELELRTPAAPGVSRLRNQRREFERRSLPFAVYAATYTVEIIRPVSAPGAR